MLLKNYVKPSTPLLYINGKISPTPLGPKVLCGKSVPQSLCDIRKRALNLIMLSTRSQLISVTFIWVQPVTLLLAIKCHKVQISLNESFFPLVWLSNTASKAIQLGQNIPQLITRSLKRTHSMSLHILFNGLKIKHYQQ